MPAFPVLTITPAYPIQRKRRDNTIKSESEAGYIQSRPRFTRKTSEFGPLDYQPLTAAEKVQIEALHDQVGCSALFTWTMPVEGSTHNVRFKEEPTFKLIGPGMWSCSFSLEEA